MPALLRHPVSRFIVGTALVGSLLDWVLFATLVVTVDTLLDGSAWATALVLLARIVPGAVFAPVAARRIDRGDLTVSLRVHEWLRVASLASLAGAFALRSVPGVLVAILALEFAASMQAAGRESAISRYVPATQFTSINTVTAILSYGFLPLGPVLVSAIGPDTGWVLTVGGGAAIACAYLRFRLPDRPANAPVAATERTEIRHGRGERGSAAGAPEWQRVVLAASLGLLPAVALFTIAPEFAEAWTGDREATGPLYAMVLAGAGVGGVLANLQRLRAEVAMLVAAAGLGALVFGWWVAGLLLVGAGAGAAYLDLQTRLQHAASDPSEFARAFATLKVSTAVAVLGSPWIASAVSLDAVLVVGAGVAVAGAAIAGPLPGRLLRLAVRELLALALQAVVRLEVRGRPADGAAVVVSNHPHWLDGAVAVLADRRLRPVARWQHHRGARAAIWAGNCVVTTAGTGRDRRPAWAQAADHLRDGGRIWLAPEGGAHADRVLRTPRSGAVRMAAAAVVPVQPLGIRWGDHQAGPDLARWRPWARRRVVVEWGRPVRCSGDVEADNNAMMRTLADVSGCTWLAAAPHAVAA